MLSNRRQTLCVPQGGEEVSVSVVVPVYNEVESVPELVEQIDKVLSLMEEETEIIIVDDGSADDTWNKLRSLQDRYERLVGVRLSVNRGQTAALMAGFDVCCGDVVVTLDGDLQNDPADIPKLLAKLDEGYEIVSGWRRNRQDKLVSRRFPSVVANWISRQLTGLTIHDNGCALKAYRGEVLRSVSLYSEFHRFIVPLAQMGGARVAEVETHHRARIYGESKYGLGRVLRVLADLTTLFMVTRYSHKLFIWFLLFAIPFVGLAAISLIWVGHILVGNFTGPLLVPVASAVLFSQTAVSIIGYGLFAERIRFLAPSRDRTTARMMATVTQGGEDRDVFIRGGRPRRILGQLSFEGR